MPEYESNFYAKDSKSSGVDVYAYNTGLTGVQATSINKTSLRPRAKMAAEACWWEFRSFGWECFLLLLHF